MKIIVGRKVTILALAVFALGSCSNWFAQKPGTGGLASLTVKVSPRSMPGVAAKQLGSRDIIPPALLPEALIYRVELDQGGAPIVRDGLSVAPDGSGIVIDGLAVGIWNLKVSGYQTIGKDIFQGATTVNLAGGPATVNLTLDPLVTGTGDLLVNLSWTAGQIDGAIAYWSTDRSHLRTSPATILPSPAEMSTVIISSSGLSISKIAIPSGTYYLTIDLNMGTGTAATVIELVRIYDNRQSTATFNLDGQISKPPLAPSGLVVTSRDPGTGGINFEWVDNSLTETGFEFFDGVSWSNLGPSVTTHSVTAPPSDTTYQVRAVNAFGASAAASYTFRPRHVLYDVNGGTGTAPSDPWTYDSVDSATALAPAGFARDGYTFANWNTTAGGGGTSYLPGAPVALAASNVSLYAQWTPNTGAITILLNDPYTLGLTNTVSVGGLAATLDRAINQSINVSAIGGYDTFSWSVLGGEGNAPLVGTPGAASTTITAQAGTTELSLFTVTLFYGYGSLQYSKSFNLQVVDNGVTTLDFEALSLGDLNGHDSWVTTQHGVIGDMQVTSGSGYDMTKQLSYDLSGAGYGVDASRSLKLTSPIQLNSVNRVYRLSFDMTKNTWGVYVGLGVDLNHDGTITYADTAKQAIILSGDIYDQMLHLFLPSDPMGVSTTSPLNADATFIPDNGWVRVVMVMQYDVVLGNVVTVRAMPLSTGIWTTLWSGQAMGTIWGAGDKTDPALWDTLFIHIEGAGGKVDNIFFDSYTVP